MITTTVCPMDLENYPMDTQTCSLVLSSFGHYNEELFLFWDGESYLYNDTTATVTQFKLMDVIQDVEYLKYRTYFQIQPFDKNPINSLKN